MQLVRIRVVVVVVIVVRELVGFVGLASRWRQRR
jgi:hypothetical protein